MEDARSRSPMSTKPGRGRRLVRVAGSWLVAVLCRQWPDKQGDQMARTACPATESTR
jgi:hypothetical protein